MARDDKARDAGKDGEDYEFIPADFDEDAFIHREIVSFRTTSILFLWGIVAALVSWGLFAAVDGAQVGWLIGLFVCAAFGFGLKFLFPRLKADVKHFGRREWLGTGFLFFFTWLAFFIIAVNPPVSDFAAPRVDVLASPQTQQAGGDVVIDAFFEDNDRVRSHDLAIIGAGGTMDAAHEDLGRGHHRYTLAAAPAGIYRVEATATDRNGHVQDANLTFTVVESALTVDLPDGDRLNDPTDAVAVDVAGTPPCTKKVRASCVRTVYLDLVGGQRVTLEYNLQIGSWIAVPNHAGWTQGQVTFTAVAEFVDSYAGNVRVDGGSISDGPYTVNVTASTGDYAPKVQGDPAAPVRSVPGVGPIVLGIALLAVVAIVRRRA